MKLYAFCFAILLVFGCQKMAEPDVEKKDIMSIIPVISYPQFYGHYNFIVENNTVYLHTYGDRGWICGTGIEIDYSKPERLYLTPDSLKEINKKGLDSLLIVWGKAEKRLLINIAGDKDYYVSPTLISYLDVNNIIMMKRKLTQEERVVLNYKIENKPFDIDNIEWAERFRYPEPRKKYNRFTNPE